jgi:hypothetical protein
MKEINDASLNTNTDNINIIEGIEDTTNQISPPDTTPQDGANNSNIQRTTPIKSTSTDAPHTTNSFPPSSIPENRTPPSTPQLIGAKLSLTILKNSITRFLSPDKWFHLALKTIISRQSDDDLMYTLLPTKMARILLSTSKGTQAHIHCINSGARQFKIDSDNDANFLLANQVSTVYVNIRISALTDSQFYQYSSPDAKNLPRTILGKPLASTTGLVAKNKCNTLNVETAILSQTNCASQLPVVCEKPLRKTPLSKAFATEFKNMHAKLKTIETWLLNSIDLSLFNSTKFPISSDCKHATSLLTRPLKQYPESFSSPLSALREASLTLRKWDWYIKLIEGIKMLEISTPFPFMTLGRDDSLENTICLIPKNLLPDFLQNIFPVLSISLSVGFFLLSLGISQFMLYLRFKPKNTNKTQTLSTNRVKKKTKPTKKKPKKTKKVNSLEMTDTPSSWTDASSVRQQENIRQTILPLQVPVNAPNSQVDIHPPPRARRVKFKTPLSDSSSHVIYAPPPFALHCTASQDPPSSSSDEGPLMRFLS